MSQAYMLPRQNQYILNSPQQSADFVNQSISTGISQLVPQQNQSQGQTVAQQMAMYDQMLSTPQQNSAMSYAGGRGQGSAPIGAIMQALGGGGGGESGGMFGGLFGGSGAGASTAMATEGAATGAAEFGAGGAAASTAGGLAGAESGLMGGSAAALASNPIGWILAAAAVPTIGSLSAGNSPEEVFLGEGWGGAPMQAIQEGFDGNFQGAAEYAMGSAPDTNLVAPFVGEGSFSENLEQSGKNAIAPIMNLTQDGNFFQNMIQALANPLMSR